MRLPAMKYGDGYTDKVQTQFGGLKHRAAAANGALWDMQNLTGDEFPLMAVRKPHGLVRSIAAPVGGIGAHSKLCWAAGGKFYYDGQEIGAVNNEAKIFAGMGQRVIIWPDKKVFHTELKTFESLEATVNAEGVKFAGGEIYGETADANSIVCGSVDFRDYFAAGDAITISGCTKHPENNKTPIIREISEDGHTMRFYENVFALDEQEEKLMDYTEPGTITFARTVPDMDWICVNENRLWGCKGDTIYASKLGDPKNFNVFDGLGTDSFSVPSGSAGDFTGCFSYGGYACFFKERAIYKMYGDLPTNFQLMGGPELGVAEGCGKSLAVAGNILFYLSPVGVMAYSGGVPTAIGEDLGDVPVKGVGGSDGLKYYLAAESAEGDKNIFVYDTRRGAWYKETHGGIIGFAALSRQLYAVAETGEIWDLNGESGTKETAVEWMAEFADFDEGSPNAKHVSRMQLRLHMEAQTEVEVQLLYDSEEEWMPAGNVYAETKRTVVLPVIPRRADHYRLRLVGRGGCKLYSLSRRIAPGSNQRTTKEN